MKNNSVTGRYGSVGNKFKKRTFLFLLVVVVVAVFVVVFIMIPTSLRSVSREYKHDIKRCDVMRYFALLCFA